MTPLQQTCTSLARANADLHLAFRLHEAMQVKPELNTLPKRQYIAHVRRKASRHINTMRFIGPGFAAANDNTMVVGVA